MVERINFDIGVTGEAKATRAFDNVASAQGRANQKTKEAGDVSRVAGSRFSELAGATGNLGTAIALANPKFSQFAGVIGTAGSSVTALMSSIGGVPGILGATLIGALGVMAVKSAHVAKEQQKMAEAVDKATAAMDKQTKAAAALFAAQDPAFAAQLSAAGGAGGLDPDAARSQIRKLTAEIEQRERRLEEVRKRHVPAVPSGAARPSFGVDPGGGFGAFGGDAALILRQEEKRSELVKAQVTQEGQRLEQLKAQRAALQQFLSTQNEVVRNQDKIDKSTSGGGGKASALGGVDPFDTKSRDDANRQRIENVKKLEQQILDRQRERELDSLQSTQKTENKRFEMQQEMAERLVAKRLRIAKETERIDNELTEKMAANHAMLNELATSSLQGIASVGINAFQDIAKGNEITSQQILQSIGEFMVADGTKWAFQGTGKVISSYGSDPAGYGLIALGAAEIAAGIGLGAAGSSGAPTGGGGQSFNPRGFQNSAGFAGNQNSGPVIINLNSTFRPTKSDGDQIVRALDENKRRGG